MEAGTSSPDWQRIEAQYSSSAYTSRQLAEMHGLSHTAINKRAREHGWRRDLAVVVQAAADTKVAAESLRQQRIRDRAAAEALRSQTTRDALLTPASGNIASAQGRSSGNIASPADDLSGNIASTEADASGNIATQRARALVDQAELDREIVDAESSLQASVRLSHRKDIAKLRRISTRLLDQLGGLLDMDEDEILGASDGLEYDDKLSLRKLASMPGQIDAVKKLGETMKLAIAMEREAFAMDKMVDPAQQMGNAIAQLVGSMRRSALPVVEVVDDDDDL